MPTYRQVTSTTLTPGSVVVRIVEPGGESRAMVRQVEKGTELGDVHPSEEMPVEEALRLAGNKRTIDQEIFIELEPGTRWRDEWGQLVT